MPTIQRLRDQKKKRPAQSSAKYYNSKAWHILRNLYIREHPLCELCLKEGKTTPAEEVHHINAFLNGWNDEAKWQLLLDKGNLMSLCKPHHKEVHKGSKALNTK